MPSRPAIRTAPLLAAAIATLAAGSLAPPARAATPLRATLAVNTIFDRLDLNGDGKIDAAEMREAREERFARLDTNHDGTIGEAELKQATDRIQRRAAIAENLMTSRLESLDTNGDGVVSREEFLDARTALPLLVDQNGDGVISKDKVLRVITALPAFQ